MEKFIIANGCVVRVKDINKGESNKALLLIHGYLEAIESWDSFIPLLSASTRVIAIDLPGHGLSPTPSEGLTMEFWAQTVAEVLRVMKVDEAVVVGHSMGGYVAQEVLHQAAPSVKGVVLLHSSLIPDTDHKRENRTRQIEVVQKGRKELLKGVIPNRFAEHNRKLHAETIEEIRELVVITEDEGIVGALESMNSRKELTQQIRESRTPLLSIYGRHDDYIDPQAAQECAATFPNMEVVWLEQSGHMGFIEEPEACAEAILEFTSKAFEQ